MRLLIALLACALAASGQIVRVNKAQASGSGLDATITVSSLNCSGANFYVVGISAYQDSKETLAVTYGASVPMTALNEYIDSIPETSHTLWVAYGVTGSASETFTATTVDYGTMTVACYSGVATSSTLDSQQTTTANNCYGCEFASVTPSEDGSLLIIAGVVNSDPVTSFTATGFTTLESKGTTAGQHYGGAMAELIQTTKAAVSPTLSVSPAGSGVATLAVFKPAGGSPPPSVIRRRIIQ